MASVLTRLEGVQHASGEVPRLIDVLNIETDFRSIRDATDRVYHRVVGGQDSLVGLISLDHVCDQFEGFSMDCPTKFPIDVTSREERLFVTHIIRGVIGILTLKLGESRVAIIGSAAAMGAMGLQRLQARNPASIQAPTES